MSDTSDNAVPAGGASPKAPARPAAEVRADIERERVAIAGSFDALRRDLDELLDAQTRRARDAGRKAAAAAPAIAGVVASLAVLRWLFRRRRATDEAARS